MFGSLKINDFSFARRHADDVRRFNDRWEYNSNNTKLVNERLANMKDGERLTFGRSEILSDVVFSFDSELDEAFVSRVQLALTKTTIGHSLENLSTNTNILVILPLSRFKNENDYILLGEGGVFELNPTKHRGAMIRVSATFFQYLPKQDENVSQANLIDRIWQTFSFVFPRGQRGQ